MLTSLIDEQYLYLSPKLHRKLLNLAEELDVALGHPDWRSPALIRVMEAFEAVCGACERKKGNT